MDQTKIVNCLQKQVSLPVASIIIPIRSQKVSDESLKRLQRLMQVIPEVFEIVVVDDGSPNKVSIQLESISGQHKNSRYTKLNTRWRRFSLARSRNRGAQESRAPVVIFHDVDFIGMPETYHSLAEYIKEIELATHPKRFFCVPVAFLKEKATTRFLTDLPDQRNQSYWTHVLALPESRKNLQHYVKGSSCIVINRKGLLELGGHDETYDGHGAEDFELLHRLCERYPIRDKPPNYSINTGSGTIQEYRGFRAFFALYGEEALNEGIGLVHLYHPKRKGWGYYKHKRNFAKLKRLMELGYD